MSSQHRALATPRVDLATCISGIVGRVEVGWRQLIQLRHCDASTALLSFSFFSLRIQASSAPSEHDLEFARDDLTSNECSVVNSRSLSLRFARLVPNGVVSAAGNVLRTARSKHGTHSNGSFETVDTLERHILNTLHIRTPRSKHVLHSNVTF